MKLKLIFWFSLAQLLVCGFVFSGGLWGESLLAPLDIAPALFPKYQFMNPASTGVPDNHFIIDQLVYDLPIQKTVYEAYHHGEVPWWDPYTFAGRPLLADAHINGTDPIRYLTYCILPFEAAYNWTRVLHFMLCGLGMLLLLRQLGFADWLCLLLALSYEFAGSFVLHFGHPWIQASFLYYPFLWLAWHGAAVQRRRWCYGIAPLLVAAIFYSGNLQSHSYLVFFGLAFAFGYAGLSWANWKRIIPLFISSAFLGACLAAPVLANQIELYFVGIHGSGVSLNKLNWLGGLLSFAGLYPWAIGTFRTLDLSKYLDQQFHFGFSVFIGSVGFLLAIVGMLSKASDASRQGPKRMAVWLCAFYFLIVSTPLARVLYLRSATLAVLGIVVLAAVGCEYLIRQRSSSRRLGVAIISLSVFVAAVTNGFAFIVYPRIQAKVQQIVEQKASGSFGNAPALRRFQVQNLPNEISFLNPEALLAWFSLIGFGVLLLSSALRSKESLWALLLALSLLPALLFSHRFIPHHPMAQWRLLLAGGPEQQRIARLMQDSPLRLSQMAPETFEQVFPSAMAHLYRVRLVQGYASLQPRSLFLLPASEQDQWKAQWADFTYLSSARGLAAGELTTNASSGPICFQWIGNSTRPFSIERIGINKMRLSFQAGAAGTLLWTDTYFPGWMASLDRASLPIAKADLCFSKMEIPPSGRELILEYAPRFLRVAKTCALIGIIGLATLGFALLRRKPHAV